MFRSLKYKSLFIIISLIFSLKLHAAEFMLDEDFAKHFAQDWIESWNSHDLDRIFLHYTNDFEMASPNIIRGGFSETGKLTGKEAVGKYWSTALQPNSPLHCTLTDVLVAVDSLTIYYKNQNGRLAAEVFFFNEDGIVYKSAAHYSIVNVAGS